MTLFVGLRRLYTKTKALQVVSPQTRAISTTTPWMQAQQTPPPASAERFWKKNAQGRYQRPIYIAATRQHVGKTTVSLAVLSGLTKRFDKVGFIKPVGQQ
jgi:Mrp family chromosome partitioning ATPase